MILYENFAIMYLMRPFRLTLFNFRDFWTNIWFLKLVIQKVRSSTLRWKVTTTGIWLKSLQEKHETVRFYYIPPQIINIIIIIAIYRVHQFPFHIYLFFCAHVDRKIYGTTWVRHTTKHCDGRTKDVEIMLNFILHLFHIFSVKKIRSKIENTYQI